jgi:hypothetical protein
METSKTESSNPIDAAQPPEPPNNDEIRELPKTRIKVN